MDALALLKDVLNGRIRRERIFRDHQDLLVHDDDDWLIGRFRLPGALLWDPCAELGPVLEKPTCRNHTIPVPLQLLGFLATSSYQCELADSTMAGWRERWKPLQLLIILSLLFLTNQSDSSSMGGSSLCFISHTHSREDQSLQLLPSPPSVPERLSSGPSEVSSTMAGWRERWKPLQLLIILSLLFLTNQSELGGDVEEKLSLRGTSQEPLQTSSPSSLINKQLLLHDDKDLDAFLLRFGKQTMEDWLQSVSEISPSFRQKVLVLTGSTNSSDVKRRQENIPDPQQRVPVSRKFLYNQSCGSESEPNQETPQIYQVLDELDPVSSSRTPQRPDDPMVEFDHQQILMLEDEEVVRTAAASLYEKHPTVSSLHAVDPQQRVQRVKGQAVALSERSSLVLVGHGARDHSGEMRISGYSYQDVARIIQSSSRTSQKIQTTTVVACDVGSDRRFREALLKELHEAGVETELHLWKTTVQVTETGELLSQDVSADGPQWRSEDHTKKVVLTVGGDRQIRTRSEEEEGRRGHRVLTKETKFLRPPKRFLVYRRSWPQNPETFINPNVFEKVNQNKVDELKKPLKNLKV
ncbi:uncharacterized protein FYW61_020992 [Anableps anableps]